MENMKKLKDLIFSLEKEFLENNNKEIKLFTDDLLFLLLKLSTINDNNSNFLFQLIQYFNRPKREGFPIGRYKSFEYIKQFSIKELMIFKSILNELSILYPEQYTFEFSSGISIISWELSRRKLLESLTATFVPIPYNFTMEEQFYTYSLEDDIESCKGINDIFSGKYWNNIPIEDFETYILKPRMYYDIKDQVRCFFFPTYIKHALELFDLEFEYVEFEDIIKFKPIIEMIAPYFYNNYNEFKCLSHAQNESICKFLQLIIADRELFYNPVIDNDPYDYKSLKKIYQDYWVNFENDR